MKLEHDKFKADYASIERQKQKLKLECDEFYVDHLIVGNLVKLFEDMYKRRGQSNSEFSVVRAFMIHIVPPWWTCRLSDVYNRFGFFPKDFMDEVYYLRDRFVFATVRTFLNDSDCEDY